MVAKADTARRGNLPFEVQALSGVELHHVKFKEESEYLLIDLGNTAGRRHDFGELMEMAMSAAVNAALASLSSKDNVKASPDSGSTKMQKLARAARNAQRRSALSERIYNDAVWLSARELSEKANFKNTNPSAGPNRWKSSGSIFAVQINGKDNYPRYLLDEGYRPLPVVKKILATFGETKTPWGLAIWFGSENSWLGGKKPKDILAQMPEQVLAAAKEERDGGIHG